ncbi:1-deoxy-D-xylulose-5-phosphate reductoisomerase [Sanguibacteroides justesenii]|uniref:1-deoxy-D-xylulose 5-phosphate reductoisomerase n=1 Tax=Sanguibacteroides justesenii TaxID=1547597 RepID=A0A0C3RCX4_9PORP|nr:1-deoxy-D-xylulose-5-phosphate reductoisomerase [Sanguibacteroides justesenii]KIO43961.1 1-deoxy-D-xylulose 5-phosphate reductoisomerase [Sanguibacteroides justesenii]KIO46529.1 1-deoxy-D-xylulose 5-phosphate reductoisomerase [Sanguibacteroides justesenii]PXZ44003.1 1-deoxy-D-xylulose-5-phosphate reductoisomerase [Sanguibacteroides justesenii]
MKNIAVLGSTGSIGTQTLQVIEANPGRFRVEVLTANNQVELLAQQAVRFKPNMVVIANEEKYGQLKELLADEDIKVYAGSEAIAQVVESSIIDTVVTAMVGYSGLLPTIRAIKAGKTIALANKETLVVAGDLIHDLVTEYKVALLPVDSEHSAIFQCLTGEMNNPVEKILLTASGGPFRGKDYEFLKRVTPEQALKHPNWKMGAKVTIDSASMMNKGFEAIEAKWLFGLKPSQIEVLVHPQSIVHSMVQFTDGCIKAQLGVPDMRLPIQYALTYPDRIVSSFERVDFSRYSNLTFEKPDPVTFRNLGLAFEAMEKGGNIPCILNAANEIAVDAFLKEKVSFTRMPEIIEETISRVCFIQKPDLQDYIETDREGRKIAVDIIEK